MVARGDEAASPKRWVAESGLRRGAIRPWPGGRSQHPSVLRKIDCLRQKVAVPRALSSPVFRTWNITGVEVFGIAPAGLGD